MNARTVAAIDADLQRCSVPLPEFITPFAIQAIKHKLDTLLDERNTATKEKP